MPTPRPTFRDLTPAECTALLNRYQVGRLAVAHRDRIELVPIHYVYDDGWLYGRTAAGTKIEMVSHLFDWASVVVKGGLHLLRKEGSDHEQAIYDKGVAIVRRIIPEALTPDDPLPDRVLLFRIHVDEISGRAAEPGR
jgi:nitroimidazol reductase NimA-like FMN-containing flavoprotein (pyridoxamine 5'-phosphate oxidase superfamily)